LVSQLSLIGLRYFGSVLKDKKFVKTPRWLITAKHLTVESLMDAVRENEEEANKRFEIRSAVASSGN